MIFLRITAADGTRQYIPDNYVVKITTAADTRDAGTAYRAANILRGKITEVKYYDGANGTAGALVVTAVSSYVTGGILYEYGSITVDGAFSQMMSN